MAHPEIALDGALDVRLGQSSLNRALEGRLPGRHRMHVRCRAPDVHHEQRSQTVLPAGAVGEQTRAFHDRLRRRHEDFVEHLRRPIDSLGVNDPIYEDPADRGARRLDIEHVEFRHDVLGGNRRLSRRVQPCGDAVRRLPVSCDDHGTGDAALREGPGIVPNHFVIAAVGAAGEQDDIGTEILDPGDVTGGQPIGVRADQPGAGAQRGNPRRFRRQLLDQPHGDHAQAARGAGRRQPVREIGKAADAAFQVRERRLHADRDVGRDRRRSLARTDDLGSLQVDRAKFGVGAAEVDEQRGRGVSAHESAVRLPPARAAKSLSRASTTSGVRVPGGKARSNPMSRKRFSTTSHGVLPTTRLPPT